MLRKGYYCIGQVSVKKTLENHVGPNLNLDSLVLTKPPLKRIYLVSSRIAGKPVLFSVYNSIDVNPSDLERNYLPIAPNSYDSCPSVETVPVWGDSCSFQYCALPRYVPVGDIIELGPPTCIDAESLSEVMARHGSPSKRNGPLPYLPFDPDYRFPLVFAPTMDFWVGGDMSVADATYTLEEELTELGLVIDSMCEDGDDIDDSDLDQYY